MLSKKVKSLFELLVILFIGFVFVMCFIQAFKDWDTAPVTYKIDCVDGTIKTEYGNCVPPEEYTNGP